MPNSTRAERSKAFVEAYRKNENVEVIPSRQDIKGDEEEEKEELVGALIRPCPDTADRCAREAGHPGLS